MQTSHTLIPILDKSDVNSVRGLLTSFDSIGEFVSIRDFSKISVSFDMDLALSGRKLTYIDCYKQVFKTILLSKMLEGYSWKKRVNLFRRIKKHSKLVSGISALVCQRKEINSKVRINLLINSWLYFYLDNEEGNNRKRIYSADGQFRRLLEVINENLCYYKKVNSVLSSNKYTHCILVSNSSVKSFILRKALNNNKVKTILIPMAYMPSVQLKNIHGGIDRFVSKLKYYKILFPDDSNIDQYEGCEGLCTTRFDFYQKLICEMLDIKFMSEWVNFIGYQNEHWAAKNHSIFCKMSKEMIPEWKNVPIVGNHEIESNIIESKAEYNVLISIAPDIFNSNRFSFSNYIDSFESYMFELKELIKKFERNTEFTFSLHPRVLEKRDLIENYLGDYGNITNNTLGDDLSKCDLFVTYVGSSINFDVADLEIPMISFSLYDNATEYLQNIHHYKHAIVVNNKSDLDGLRVNTIMKSAKKYRIQSPLLGSVAKNIMLNFY